MIQNLRLNLKVKKMPEEVKNSGFVLKPAYKNIQRKDISKFPITNENLNNELAIKLIGYHPKGYGLFKSLPAIKQLDVKKEVEQLSVSLNNIDFKVIDSQKAFYEITKKPMFEPTPYKFQVYFKKLSRNKRDKIIEFLKGV